MHVDLFTAPADLRLLTLDLLTDSTIEVLEVSALPRAWAQVPAPPELQMIGTAWLRSRRTVALSVPSAVIKVERNILLNPLHPEAEGIRLIGDEPFSFDPRLFATQ